MVPPTRGGCISFSALRIRKIPLQSCRTLLYNRNRNKPLQEVHTMKITILDGAVENPGDLSWEASPPWAT